MIIKIMEAPQQTVNIKSLRDGTLFYTGFPGEDNLCLKIPNKRYITSMGEVELIAINLQTMNYLIADIDVTPVPKGVVIEIGNWSTT